MSLRYSETLKIHFLCINFCLWCCSCSRYFKKKSRLVSGKFEEKDCVMHFCQLSMQTQLGGNLQPISGVASCIFCRSGKLNPAKPFWKNRKPSDNILHVAYFHYMALCFHVIAGHCSSFLVATATLQAISGS